MIESQDPTTYILHRSLNCAIKMNYPNINKLALMFLVLVKKLRLYFQAYVIAMMMSYLIWQVLLKLDTFLSW